jgi:hypothetical protein
MMRWLRWLLLAAVVGCTDAGVAPAPVPTTTPNSQLHIVAQDTSAPVLLSDSVSFYAVAGQGRQVKMYYQGAAPGDTGETLLEFEVPDNALLKRPNGTAFQPGDSVLITITVTTPGRFQFTFGPSGLTFNPASPARLKIEYGHCDHDFNDDGQVDPADSTVQTLLDVWRRETGDTLWTKLGGVNLDDDAEVSVNVLSFTEYALAW